MKKLIVFMLCAVMALSLAACSSAASKDEPQQPIGGQVQIPNPIVNYDTIEDAKKVVGFEFNTPSNLPEGFMQEQVSVVGGKLVKIIYQKDDAEVRYRVCKGSDDISGDYNEYEVNETVNIGEVSVSVRGNNDKINVATWQADGYSYALGFDTGFELDTVKTIIKSL